MTGAYFKEAVRKLNVEGKISEEAFAQLLGIEGDPYEGLLEYQLD